MTDPYHTQELASQNFETLAKFSFCGLVTKAKVVDVHDGDTVTVVFYYGELPIKHAFRMLGYDTPELHPLKTISNHDLHIKAGQCSRDYLKRKVLHQIVWIKFCQEDKYGRLMGEIYTIGCDNCDRFTGGEFCINQDMIIRGYGKAYDGGKKGEFTEDDLQRIISQWSEDSL